MSDIMSISRLRMGTDGEGITTLIGFYGCPLKCKYCLNHYCKQEDTVRADYSVEELLKALSVDESYFLMTGGGVTFGGGEPLLQAEFIHEVCQKMSKKWKRNIETSLYASWEQIALLLDDIDYWFVDIKDIDERRYQAYTGKSNKEVISNLKKLVDAVGTKKVCVRIPLIAKYNTKAAQDEAVYYIWENISDEVAVDVFEYVRC